MGKLTILGVLATGIASFVLISFALPLLLRPVNVVSSVMDPDKSVSIAQFLYYGVIGLGVAFFLSVVWWLVGSFVTKRQVILWWVFALIVMAASLIPGIFLIKAGVIYKFWALLAYFLTNGVLMFWGSTALFSPDTVRYDPLLADKIRGKW